MSDQFDSNERMTSDVTTPPATPKFIEVEKYERKYAGFWIRFWAYLIDGIVVFSINSMVIKPIFNVAGWEVTNPGFLLFSPYKTVALLVFLLYFALTTKWFGQTVGKMIMGIRVVQMDGSPLNWGNIFFREVIGRFISKLLPILYLLVIFMPKKEALHDLFADTVVVHEEVYRRVIRKQRVVGLQDDQLQNEPSV